MIDCKVRALLPHLHLFYVISTIGDSASSKRTLQSLMITKRKMIDMSAIILSGGKSSRMGEEDKPFLPFGQEQTMIEHIIKRLGAVFPEIILVTRKPSKYKHVGVKVVEDIYSAGPLGGLHAGLYHASSPYSFVMGCDMPFVNLELVKSMLERARKDILIPMIEGNLEPLHAIYHKKCLPFIEKEIHKNRFKVISFFKDVEIEYIYLPQIEEIDKKLYTFFNINNKEDYQLALQLEKESR